MHLIDGDGHFNNRFRGEDAANNILATVVTPEWLNSVQTELATLAKAAGAGLSKSDDAQCIASIQALIANAIAAADTTMTDAAIFRAIVRTTGVRIMPVNYANQAAAKEHGFVLLDGSLVPFGSDWTQANKDAIHALVGAGAEHEGIWTAYTQNQSIATEDWNRCYAAIDRDRGALGEVQDAQINDIKRIDSYETVSGSPYAGLTEIAESGETRIQQTNNPSAASGNRYMSLYKDGLENRPRNANIAAHWGFYFLAV